MSTPLPDFGLQFRGCEPFTFVEKEGSYDCMGLPLLTSRVSQFSPGISQHRSFYFVTTSMDGISIDGCLDRFFCKSLLCTANTFNFYHVKI
jgi:hypothetical protein